MLNINCSILFKIICLTGGIKYYLYIFNKDFPAHKGARIEDSNLDPMPKACAVDYPLLIKTIQYIKKVWIEPALL